MSLKLSHLKLWSRWRGVAKPSMNRRILGAAATITILTFGAKLLSMVKDSAVAASFGAGDTMDAFLIAYVLPNFVVGVISGSFNAALIPTYIQVRDREGRQAAQRLLSGTVLISSILLLGVTVALALLGPAALPMLGRGFGPAKLQLTERLFYALLPMIALSGLATNWGAALNAGEHFGLVALSPALVPVASVAALIGLSRTWGVYALALGTVGGFALQLCMLGWALRKQGLRLWPRWHGYDKPMRVVIGQFVPMVAAGILMNSTTLVDQAMASMLAPGSVAALGYGNKLVNLFVGVSTAAIGTALLPYLSKMIAADDWAGLRHTLRTYSKLIVVTTVPLTAALCFLSPQIVRLLFQRGAFTAADTQVVAWVQTMYLIQIPFFTLAILFVRTISSLRASTILTLGTIISFTANIVLDYVLMHFMGAAGIALSTAGVYLISLCFLSFMCYRLIRDK